MAEKREWVMSLTLKKAGKIVKKGKTDCKRYLSIKIKWEIADKIKCLRNQEEEAIEKNNHLQAIAINARIKSWQLIIDQDDSNQKKWMEVGK